MNPLFFVAIILAVAVVAIIWSSRQRNEPGDIPVPPPPSRRNNLLFGYFGVHGEQLGETLNHVSLIWLWDFLSPSRIIDLIVQAPGKAVVLDLAPYLWSAPRPKQPRLDAEAAVRGLFRLLRNEGVLNRVSMLVPIDEPNIGANQSTVEHLPWAAELMRRLAGEFPELSGVKLGCVYTGQEDIVHLDLWDVVGINNYDLRSSILTPGGQYDQLKARLQPHQQTMLFPGGYSDVKQDPAPFVNFAHSNPEVWAVIGFLWATVPWEKFQGIRDLDDVRWQYVAAGQSILEAA